jgi:hypothetical protein
MSTRAPIDIHHGTTRVILHVAQASQDDLDRGAPVRAVMPRLQDAETPNRIVKQLGIRRLGSVRHEPIVVVVVLDCD